jgi:hypothetical protein
VSTARNVSPREPSLASTSMAASSSAVRRPGFAGPDGEFDFFPFEGEAAQAILAEYPETMPVQARGPLGIADAANRHFDTVIMGRGTYEPGLKAGIAGPYPHLRQYVVATTHQGPTRTSRSSPGTRSGSSATSSGRTGSASGWPAAGNSPACSGTRSTS